MKTLAATSLQGSSYSKKLPKPKIGEHFRFLTCELLMLLYPNWGMAALMIQLLGLKNLNYLTCSIWH